MSATVSALLRLHARRADLVRWLDAPTRRAADWTDWSRVFGWYDGLAFKIAEADAILARLPTHRDGMRWFVDTPDLPAHSCLQYDADLGVLTAASLVFEPFDVAPLIAFLTLARGAAASLDPDATGVALVHDYLWMRGDMSATLAALRVGPNGVWRFLHRRECPKVARSLLPFVEEMLHPFRTRTDYVTPLPRLADDLDALR